MQSQAANNRQRLQKLCQPGRTKITNTKIIQQLILGSLSCKKNARIRRQEAACRLVFVAGLRMAPLYMCLFHHVRPSFAGLMYLCMQNAHFGCWLNVFFHCPVLFRIFVGASLSLQLWPLLVIDFSGFLVVSLQGF